MPPTQADLLAPRWRGQRHRLEVWYATLTDPATGTGFWIHHEVVAPVAGEPYAHGWTAVFPPGGPPVCERFGPEPSVDEGLMRGTAGALEWDLRYEDGGPPLFTFPQWAWEREVLPAAQVVPYPTASFDGTVRVGERVIELSGAPGNLARIYGHGNAERWAWLHADLGGGDVCELVAAAPRRRGPVLLPPIPVLQLRVDGQDWPSRQLGLRRPIARIDESSFSVRVASGRRRVRVETTLPPLERVAVGYVDPDGATATCMNSERASATITLERWDGRWREERSWRLDATAHAEIGARP